MIPLPDRIARAIEHLHDAERNFAQYPKLAWRSTIAAELEIEVIRGQLRAELRQKGHLHD